MDILDKFTGHLKNALARAFSLAVEMDSPDINPEHLMLSLLLQKGSVGGELLRKADLGSEEVRRLLRLADELALRQGKTPPSRNKGLGPKLSSDARRAVEKAVLTANSRAHRYVGTEHLLAGLLEIDSPAIEAILIDQNVSPLELKERVGSVLESASKFPEVAGGLKAKETEGAKDAEVVEDVEGPVRDSGRQDSHTGKHARSSALEFFAVELTDPEVQKKIDPVIGRDKEIERIIQILCRKTKNNPVLLGEPGVGKTAIVEGLAKRILEGDVPAVLAGKRIYSLDLGMMVAGTIYRGEFEGRVKQIIEEVRNDPNIIVFIDELHNITGAGSTNGSLDAANILKPALARGELRCIGATTIAEFKKSIESDGALERRFQPVNVDPPTPEMTVEILRGLRRGYETWHGVAISDEAIEAAVTLSDRYITDRFLPDKAIDLIDEAAAIVRVGMAEKAGKRRTRLTEEELKKVSTRKRLAVENENFVAALELKSQERRLEDKLAHLKDDAPKRKKKADGSIGRKEIAELVARATGIPVTDLLREERDKLLNLEEIIGRRIIGQEEAVKAVAELVRRAKAGIGDPQRPLASFLFTGPSGVGKTEMAKVLAETVFQDPDALVRIDMSEFSEGFNISKLIGSPAGYVGYKDRTKLTDAVKRKPHSVVLFDEIEKAHPEVHNLLLSILEDGHITDATGRKINFKNAVIIMTSNVGAREMATESIGFGAGDAVDGDATEARATMKKELERTFPPEFLNRVDRLVFFHPLAKKDLAGIVRLQISELADRLRRDHGLELSAAPKAIELLAEKSWDPLYGARGVRRQVQDLVENPLAAEMLARGRSAADNIVVEAKDGRIRLARKRAVVRAAN